MFNAANSYAQIGSSNSNPHLINLNYGAGYGEFQFHYPDTVMYVKLVGLQNKQNFYFNIDTTSSLVIKRITIKKIDNLANNIYDSEVSSLNYNLSLNNIYFTNIDSALLLIKKESFSNSCNYCDTANLKLGISLIQQILPDCSGDPRYCDNLVRNGDLEQFAPQFDENIPTETSPPYTGTFVFPHWGILGMDESATCGWNYEWYTQPGGYTMEVSPTYVNSWFDDPLTFPTCTLNIPINTLFQCNNLSAYGLTPQSCNIQTQQNNYFFPNNLGFTNEGYIRNSLAVPSRMMRGQIDPPLQANKKYYLEVNIGAPNAGTYGGLIDIDVSSSPNYNQASYQGGATPAVLELQINGFDYDANNLWRKFNTIFTTSATGNESRIYAGNLSHSAYGQFPSANPVGTYCYNMGNGSYFFDNFIVKEFFADAGNPTIACEGAPVQIGGNSCPFPNAVYNWQPSAYFVDNTIQNPTFILPLGSGLSNVTCTLTVTIPMADGTFATTDPSYVDITIIQGNSIALLGTTSVVIGGYTTLYANNGSNYVWTGSDGTSNTGASINVGPLTQDVTYTVNALSNSGCSVTEIITVTVTPLPAACISDPNYPNTIIIPDGTVDATFLAMNLGVYVGTVYVVTSKNFALAGTLNLSSAMNVKFENCHFYCYDASEILNYGMLDLHRSRFEACNKMWKGIQNNFGIRVESCNFKDAEFAIHLKNLSRYRISTTTFENNLYGIFMGETNILTVITGSDFNNQFANPLPLKPAYANMLNWQPKSESGIRIESMKYPIQIGLEIANAAPLSITNKFYTINNGIYIVNSDVNVVNSMFFSITPLILRTVPVFLKYDGCAIYAQSTFIPKKLMVSPIANYTGHEFANCTEGIKTNRVSLNAVKLSMNNVGSGIQCFNSLMCIHYVCENTITSQFRGIEISGAGFANSVNVNSNVITVSNLIASSGISVTATQLGNANNVNIKFNVITAGRTTMNGILTSKLSSPTLLCNTVKRVNNSSQYSQLIALNGYNISGCNGANLTTNSMEWLSAGSTANNGNDYIITSSTGSELVCNYSSVSNVGFKVSSNCIDLTFRRNKIGSHAIGLYYDNTANSGSQPANPTDPTEGNRWLGAYSALGAKNEALPPDVNNSIFYYHPSNTNINKPANNSWFPPNWFNANGSSLIQADCTIGPCVLNQIAPPDNISHYRAIANGSIITIGYPAQTKWMAQSYLINRLGKDTTLRNSDDSLHYFYYAPENRTLRTIREIDARNNNYAATSKLISNSVYANDSLLNVLSQNMTLQLSDTLMPDSVFYNLSANLQEQYAFINDINEGFSNDIFELLSENLNQAKEINDTLQSTNANETILQTINDIYYRYHKSNYVKINEDDASMIAYIAHLCPLAAGPAVYQARDLYTLLVDSVVYHDSVKCAMQGYAREELQVFEPKVAIQKIAPAYFKAFPVPSKHAVELHFTELSSEANLTVFNIQGQLIYQSTIPKGISKFNLDIEEYSEGVYQVLLVNNEFSKISKICKIK